MDTHKHGSQENLSIKRDSLCKLVVRKKLVSFTKNIAIFSFFKLSDKTGRIE